jgi:hypothetical protein
MMEHLGGPMSSEKIVERRQRYEGLPGTGKGPMFKIVEGETGESVGSVGTGSGSRAKDWCTSRAGWCCRPSKDTASRRAPPPWWSNGRWRTGSIGPQRVSVGRQRALECDLPQARLHAHPREEYAYPKGSGNILRCND